MNAAVDRGAGSAIRPAAGTGRRLRPALAWALLGVGLLSAWGLTTAPADSISRPGVSGSATAPAARPGAVLHTGLSLAIPYGATLHSTQAHQPLPPELAAPSLAPASFDPFVGAPSTPLRPASGLKPAATVALPIPAVMPVAPPTPQPPVVQHRYFGQLRAPTGELIAFLARGDQMLAIAPGQMLEGGYVVEAIEPDAVRLHYPPMDHRVSLATGLTAGAMAKAGQR